jgi:hypothetical protein
MNVAVQVELKAEKKEPLGALLRRVADLFERNGLQPEILATFSDGPGGIRPTSAVERAIRKHPHLARFERDDAPLQGIPTIRRLTNADASDPFLWSDLLALADGVPRSLPFHAVTVHFGHAEFGQVLGLSAPLTPRTGIMVGDSWWVNGRSRSLSALYAVEGDAASKKLPNPTAAIAAILAGFGKPRRTAQFVMPVGVAPVPATTGDAVQPPPQDIALVGPIIAKYRTGLRALVERIGLPHDLPPSAEAFQINRGATGPLKPTLVKIFAPRGYDCRGGSGTFTLRRRTATNHIVDVELDVGTWSRSLTFMFHVRGPGFNATLMPPVRPGDAARQYPIGDTANWERIVENVAAIVGELERTFVAEIEAAVEPAPVWFEPGR